MRKDFDSWGRKIKYKYQYNYDIFNQKSYLFYYLLGSFISDGNVYFAKNKSGCKSSISSKDLDWLKLINRVVSLNNLITTKNNYSELRIFDRYIGQILNDNGCIPNKSLCVTLPSIPDLYFRDFIRGCMDGDGSISLPEKNIKKSYGTYKYKVPTCYLCSASKIFLEEISSKLTKLGFKHYFITLKPKKRMIFNQEINTTRPMYRLLFNNNDCYKFIKWIYYDQNILCMPRKEKIGKDIIDHSILKQEAKKLTVVAKST